MEKDLIFFGDGGITDTTANRIADFAKLSYMEDESYLSSISFIDQKVETIDGENQKDLAYGTKDLSSVEPMIERIGQLKALCAWLREAVAAHQRLLSEIKRYSFSDYTKDRNIVLPDVPMREGTITEDDVISGFDVKKRNRYYYLEAMAATIGQFIHKNGPIDIARKQYYDKLTHPRSTSGTGLDTLIYTYSPSVDKKEIEDTFYSLQQKHASFQSELNGIKSEIKSRITNDDIDKDNRYEKALKEYHDAENDVFAQYNTWKTEESKRIAALKIIIPNSLKDIFEEIASTGKTN